MADLNLNRNLLIALRRFATEPLSGADLAEIRDKVLDITQDDAGSRWGVGRNMITKLENMNPPDEKTCDSYVGMMVRLMMAQSAADSGSSTK